MLLVIANPGLANNSASLITYKSHEAETLGTVTIDEVPKISGEIAAVGTQAWQGCDEGLRWPKDEETVRSCHVDELNYEAVLCGLLWIGDHAW